MPTKTRHWRVTGEVRKPPDDVPVSYGHVVTTRVRDAEAAKDAYRDFCEEMDWSVDRITDVQLVNEVVR